ncbi:phage portal protein [Brevundimonas intermedia]|uniref:Phage portal protein n=1 Tax=Brevundimonas intermedia TaxID=74315 RepID=A0ABQ5T9Z1_9CAUL|nr:phage portal protein [Brevundimonas intermedia]GLK49630.1 phage portal protein [Brevundimonas intermedia]
MTMALPSRGRALARARSSSSFSRPIEGEILPTTRSAEPMAFSLGDAEPILNRRELLDHLECWPVQGVGGRYYQTPLPRDVLSRTANVTSHHSSAFRVKVNQLLRDFIPSSTLDLTTFEGLVLDHLVFGDYFVERINNLGGRPMKLKRSLARFTRVGVEPGNYVFLNGFMREHWFENGSVFHGMQPWLDQEIYGVPEYLGGLQSAWLNEGATLFRRRFFLNGAHAGFIMYVGKGGLQEDDAEKIKAAIRDTKGVGNFKSLFVHLPQGEKDSIQILHPGEAAAKDEFVGIKDVTRDDILAAHRVPPQLLGIIPKTAGGFGDVQKAEEVFYMTEIIPLQRRFLTINEWLGVDVVRFKERVYPA